MFFQKHIHTYLLRVEIMLTAKLISCGKMASCIGDVIFISAFAILLAMAIVSGVFGSFVRFVAYI